MNFLEAQISFNLHVKIPTGYMEFAMEYHESPREYLQTVGVRSVSWPHAALTLVKISSASVNWQERSVNYA